MLGHALGVLRIGNTPRLSGPGVLGYSLDVLKKRSVAKRDRQVDRSLHGDPVFRSMKGTLGGDANTFAQRRRNIMLATDLRQSA